MEKIEMCRKYTRFGRPEQRTLVYYVTAERRAVPTAYGVGIAVAETGEERCLCGIAVSREAAERLADLLATGGATPEGMAAFFPAAVLFPAGA